MVKEYTGRVEPQIDEEFGKMVNGLNGFKTKKEIISSHKSTEFSEINI